MSKMEYVGEIMWDVPSGTNTSPWKKPDQWRL